MCLQESYSRVSLPPFLPLDVQNKHCEPHLLPIAATGYTNRIYYYEHEIRTRVLQTGLYCKLSGHIQKHVSCPRLALHVMGVDNYPAHKILCHLLIY